MKRTSTALILIAGLALGGCAAAEPTDPPVAESPSPSPTATPTPTPTTEPGPVAYTDIDELRLAFIDATGEPCPPHSQYYSDANGVICTQDGWQLFWKASLEERNDVLQLNVDSMEPSPFVVGPNWLINGQGDLADYQVIADAMNATVWTHDQPIPAE
jgi:hypothetical protein